MRNYRTFSKEFKKQVVEEILSETITVAAASRKYGVVYQVIKHWQKAYELGRLDNEPTTESGLKERTEQLEQMVGRLTMENEFLKKALKSLYTNHRQKERLSKATNNLSEASVGGVKC